MADRKRKFIELSYECPSFTQATTILDEAWCKDCPNCAWLKTTKCPFEHKEKKHG